jgi:hypothetical protein
MRPPGLPRPPSHVPECGMDEQQLIDKLRLVETLFAGAGTEGERDAAAHARDRIHRRLEAVRESDPPVEYKFYLPDRWSRRLLLALMRRYEIQPYRHAGQRRTTVMARVSKRFVDDTLWPEYLELDKLLRTYLGEVTDRVIREALHADTSDAEVRQTLP